MSEFTQPTFVIAGFTQFVADNINHNVSSLNGRGTFHGMGFIACSMEKKLWHRASIFRKAELLGPQPNWNRKHYSWQQTSRKKYNYYVATDLP